ncbi:MAG TPA: hypothetical protein VF163_08485 [Micromonosporaceae bacterium]
METATLSTDDLVASLEEIRQVPMDLISAELAGDIVRGILDQDCAQASVDVARFGSAI